MAGVYIHIPFCKAKCAYCDFFSVTSIKYQEKFVEAICKEIIFQKNYLSQDKVQTVYFGGGTPSLLKPSELEVILSVLYENLNIEKNCEITLEANPDDLNKAYLKTIREIGINRLSIGVQSFRDEDLLKMRRKHNASQAKSSIQEAYNQGFKNISIDLIYGLPDLRLKDWESNIDQAMELNIQHLSAYHLTIEPKTLFYKYHQQKKLNLPTDDESIEQFKMLIGKTEQNGFLQYEISNFAKDGFISLHNTNYWMDVKYLGLGPSAHSYNLTSRQWNIQNLQAYLDAIFKGEIPKEDEILSKNEKYNEYLIISLRTMWGLNTEKLKRDFGNKLKNEFERKAKKYIEKGLIKKSGENYKLTQEGMFISDYIMQDFFHD